MLITDKIKLKQELLDTLERARRKLVDRIRELTTELEHGVDLAVLERSAQEAGATFKRECDVAVDTYITTFAMKHYGG